MAQPIPLTLTPKGADPADRLADAVDNIPMPSSPRWSFCNSCTTAVSWTYCADWWALETG